jgi:hypothetical protein
VWNLFIHRLVHFTQEYHAFKTCWHMDKCVDGQSTNLWMNECHTNFSFSYKYVLNVFSMHEMYKLWMNKFCKIFIIKSWNVKFVMMVRDGSWKACGWRGDMSLEWSKWVVHDACIMGKGQNMIWNMCMF